jgi:hypothetical protein
MGTLLEGYIANSPPLEWSHQFKEAANVAYMVKYMFRESLPRAKEKFRAYLDDPDNFDKKRIPHAAKQHEILTGVINHTFNAYGEVGIFDPEKLATIDFLNHPQLLINLVMESANRGSRKFKFDMLKMNEVTSKWMQYMISRNFPPLTPHHTQGFTVLMMSRFFEEYLKEDPPDAAADKNAGGGWLSGFTKKKKLDLRAFIAQMATGEGKSIVISMLAIFMVQLHGMKVHILENNEGLLDRDYATNKPFFESFGITCGIDLLDESAQVVYCLKSRINQVSKQASSTHTLPSSLTQ